MGVLSWVIVDPAGRRFRSAWAALGATAAVLIMQAQLGAGMRGFAASCWDPQAGPAALVRAAARGLPLLVCPIAAALVARLIGGRVRARLLRTMTVGKGVRTAARAVPPLLWVGVAAWLAGQWRSWLSGGGPGDLLGLGADLLLGLSVVACAAGVAELLGELPTQQDGRPLRS